MTVASSVDHQRLSGYLEQMYSSRLSGFVEVPVRFLNPSLDPAFAARTIDNSSGLGDVNAGFRYGLVQCDHRTITFQLRILAPTGDARRGLGTDHVSIEPSFLGQRAWNDRLTTFSEFRAWIPISDSQANGEDFADTVLRYGVGASYTLTESCVGCETGRLDGVAEAVGWTVLGGQKFNPLRPTETDAAGDTIVNLKIGGRWSVGSRSFSVSYGNALTSEVWYEDIVRAEYVWLY